MKTTLSMLAAAAALTVLATAIGCGNNQSPSPSASEAPASAASSPAPSPAPASTTATAEGQTEIVRTSVAEATPEPPTPGEVAAPAAQDSAANIQGLIDNAKSLIGQSKWTEALALLSSLSGRVLSPEHASAVKSLTQQAQQSLAASAQNQAVDGALKSAGGFLKKD